MKMISVINFISTKLYTKLTLVFFICIALYLTKHSVILCIRKVSRNIHVQTKIALVIVSTSIIQFFFTKIITCDNYLFKMYGLWYFIFSKLAVIRCMHIWRSILRYFWYIKYYKRYFLKYKSCMWYISEWKWSIMISLTCNPSYLFIMT